MSPSQKFRTNVGLLKGIAAFGVVLTVSMAGVAAYGQAAPKRGTAAPQKPAAAPQDDFQRHFAAARTFQLSGDQERAGREYSAFLTGALRSGARALVEVGDQDRALALFDQALLVAPNDVDTLADYAQLLFRQEKMPEARAMAERALKTSADNPRAQLILGQVLFTQKDYKGAREHLEAAVVGAPTFDTGYLLGITYIKLGDFARARLVFDDLTAGFGDTVRMHMMFGMAYKEGGWEALDNAIAELKKALAKDSQAQRAHFLLALAYIDRDGESAFPQAADELRAELKINPQDSRAHYLLGYIAMKQRDAKTAEAELLRSTQLDPKNPDPLVYLGQIYSDADRDAEAETMLRKAIALSGNASKSDYLIGRAHYVLGRLILKAGKREEAERELALSQQIRDRMNRPDSTRDSRSKTDPELSSVSDSAPVGGPVPAPTVPPQAAEGIRAYVDGLKPAIADSYNNLGVIEAGRKNFKVAAAYFRKAGEWSPGLETLDRNWGMASFYAEDYETALAPLSRQLGKQPGDIRVRAALALSYFSLQNFSATIETVKPVESQVGGDPGVGYAYAVSLVKTGQYDEGVRRLRAMADLDPKSADLHLMLGSAFADQHEYETALQEYRKALAIDPNHMQAHYQAGVALIRSGRPKEAVDDLRAALKLSPQNVPAKYHLAFSLIQAQEKQEAQTLLGQVIAQDPNYGDAYYELGKLQLEQGDSKSAMGTLENGVKASPNADYIHYQLAMAYRREQRMDDAERELKLYQTLKNRNRGRGDAPQTE